jgi:peptide/nickel transport system substrate-binding protein
MSFRTVKIWLRIFLAYLRRQLSSFFKNPWHLSTFKIGLLLFFIFAFLAIFFGVRAKNQLIHPTLSEGIIGLYKEGEYPPLVSNLLSNGLFDIDESGKVTPMLASAIESNPEGTEYTVRLRDNLKWIDGSKLISKDINFSFSGAQVSYPDDQTIVFKLSEPFSPFPSLLTKPVFRGNTNMGVGPYNLIRVKNNLEEGYQVKRLELQPTDPNLPNVNIYMYSTESLAKEALKLGEIESILGINDPSVYQDQNILKFFAKTNLTQLVAIFYNTKDSILSDDNFRLALSFAAPTIPGQKEAKTTLPDSSWAFNASVKDYLDNAGMAKTYLEKVKNGRDQTVTLTTTASLESVGQLVVDSWNKNGIKSQLQVESGVPQNFQALLITEAIPADPDQYALWHSTQTSTNISKVSNPRIDKDLEDGRRATDSAKRKEAYQDFQKVLLDHAPATPLYFGKTNVVYNRKVEDQLMKVINLQLGQ